MSGVRPVLHSYALRAYPVEHVFAFAAADGWPAVELSAWHFDLDAHKVHADIRHAAEFARRYGVEIHCTNYWAEFTAADESERRHWVETVYNVIDASLAQGIGLVNGSAGWLVADPVDWDADWRGNGSVIASEQHLRWVAESYRLVAQYAADHGVRIAIEVHPNTVHDTVAATARLLELADHENLLVTLDPANAALVEEDRDPRVIDQVIDRVAYFHLKNGLVSGGRVDFTVDAAAGLIDNYRWLSRLVDVPRVTDVCVEYCGDGDPHPRLTAGRRYLEETLRLVRLER